MLPPILPSKGIVLLAYILISVARGVQFTNSDYGGITAGQDFEISWSGDDTPVSLKLLTGSPSDLQPVAEIGREPLFFSPLLCPPLLLPLPHSPPPPSRHKTKPQQEPATSPYTWPVPRNLPSGTYALSITQSGSTNYSPQFSISGSEPTANSASVALLTVTPIISVTATPTPAYMLHGLLGGMNTSSLLYPSGSESRAGAVSPTGVVGMQYQAFESGCDGGWGGGGWWGNSRRGYWGECGIWAAGAVLGTAGWALVFGG